MDSENSSDKDVSESFPKDFFEREDIGFKKPVLNWKRPKTNILKSKPFKETPILIVEETSITHAKPFEEQGPVSEVRSAASIIPESSVQHDISSAPKELKPEGGNNAEEDPPDLADADKEVVKEIEFPYKEPSWHGLPDAKYYLEELKGGVIERNIDISERSATVIGRMQGCHITLLHPSVSRFHAILQFRATRHGIYDKGFYVYDLGSVHGTFLNKLRVRPQTYQRIRVGHILKFGCSSRMFILQGPEDDAEVESEFTVTELKAMREEELKQRRKKEEEEERKLKEEEEKKLQRGVDWGMGEDADAETDLSENPYALLSNEEQYVDDPKKELMKWLERHGEEMLFETEQSDRGKIVSRITLPVVDEKGKDVIIEATGKSKKIATTTCALEACQLIDRMGLWKESRKDAQKRTVRNWEENDYYDSDEDSYFDRTGDLETKRQKRMNKAGKFSNSVETYESLLKKHEDVIKELETNENELTRLSTLVNADSSTTAPSDMDELDAFMQNLKRERPSKLQIKSCKARIDDLREQEKRLIDLINIAKPATIPDLKPAVIKSNQTYNTPPMPIESNEGVYIPQPLDDKEGGLVYNNEETKSEEKKPRVIGPSLPPTLSSPTASSKKNRIRKHGRKLKTLGDEKREDDYNNIVWAPPKGQTGDGRTDLNDKYGY